VSGDYEDMVLDLASRGFRRAPRKEPWLATDNPETISQWLRDHRASLHWAGDEQAPAARASAIIGWSLRSRRAPVARCACERG
jgi:hypothetical protein